MGTQIYARIKRTSKYFYGQGTSEPFPVEFETASDSHSRRAGSVEGYIASGNGNQYRLADLQLLIKQGEQFVRIG